ncbi:hypothetical protein HMPREF1619_03436 [Klebsiella pneumoniae 909957]|nr:hypothetical protein HMPREF1619_03436 [Klebsiella pneumoniae 909957]
MAAAEVAYADGDKGVRTANFAVLIHRGIKSQQLKRCGLSSRQVIYRKVIT